MKQVLLPCQSDTKKQFAALPQGIKSFSCIERGRFAAGAFARSVSVCFSAMSMGGGWEVMSWPKFERAMK